MVIRTKEEFEKAKEKIDQNLLTNPEFENIVHWEFFYQQSNGKRVTMYIDENGKSIRILQAMEVKRDDTIPNSNITAVDINLNERGQMTVTKSFGTLYDADIYYREIPEQRPSYHATSVLVSSYSNSIYDSNGIQLSYSHYFKGPWNLDGPRARFDNEEEFKNQLLSDGWHKPKKWYYNGPEVPQFCQNATVSGVCRTGKPGIAEVYSYDVDMHGMAKYGKRQLGQIHGEYPDRLRVDEWGKFAEFDPSKGKFTVTPQCADSYPGMTVDEIQEMISENQMSVLETSNLARYMRGNEKMEQQYNALVEMINGSNTSKKR